LPQHLFDRGIAVSAMNLLVGRYHPRPQLAKKRGNKALAAADASGQADNGFPGEHVPNDTLKFASQRRARTWPGAGSNAPGFAPLPPKTRSSTPAPGCALRRRRTRDTAMASW